MEPETQNRPKEQEIEEETSNQPEIAEHLDDQNTDELAKTDSVEESTEEPLRRNIHFPNLILKLGMWPVNIGLFFFYNNVVSLIVLLIGLIIMSSTGVDDQQIITQKLGGLSVISTVITLGLTLIYSRKFYFTRD